ncbi:MAG: orotidine-5'-phosphate decarboxylase, partial [Planctomycetaceae bacterium]
MPNYATRLHAAVRSKGTPALVGIDPRFDRLPKPCIAAAEKRNPPDQRALTAAAFETFCFELIDVVAPLVPAVKPQAAFFEECGPKGSAVLGRVIRRARDRGLIVICDAKRGDIGSTAEAYARGYLAGEDPDASAWAADALTVNPFLGPDTLAPFIAVAAERYAGLYVLVRTSNPQAGRFQDRDADAVPLYRDIGQIVENLTNETRGGEPFGFVGAVVGATCPEELAELRDAMPHVPLLVPGYGSQGGNASDVAAAFTPDGLGALVNSSRNINFAHARPPYAEDFGDDRWQEAVEAASREMIADLAANT